MMMNVSGISFFVLFQLCCFFLDIWLHIEYSLWQPQCAYAKIDIKTAERTNTTACCPLT